MLPLCLLGPAETPSDSLATLNAAIAKAVRADAVKTSFVKFAVDPRTSSIRETATFIKQEYVKWKKVIDNSRIPLE